MYAIFLVTSYFFPCHIPCQIPCHKRGSLTLQNNTEEIKIKKEKKSNLSLSVLIWIVPTLSIKSACGSFLFPYNRCKRNH